MIVKGCKWFLMIIVMEELNFVLDSTLSFVVIESLHLWRSQRTFASVVLASRKITKSIRTFYSEQLLCTHCRSCVMKSHITYAIVNIIHIIRYCGFYNWIHRLITSKLWCFSFPSNISVDSISSVCSIDSICTCTNSIWFPGSIWLFGSLAVVEFELHPLKKGQRWKWILTWSHNSFYKIERGLTLGVKASGRRTLRFVTWVENITQCFFWSVSKDVHQRICFLVGCIFSGLLYIDRPERQGQVAQGRLECRGWTLP